MNELNAQEQVIPEEELAEKDVTEIRGDMRDLFFFLNFPLMAVTGNFVGKVFFQGVSIGQPLMLRIWEAPKIILLTMLMFYPISSLAISHFYTIKKLRLPIRTEIFSEINTADSYNWATTVVVCAILLPYLFWNDHGMRPVALGIILAITLTVYFFYKHKMLEQRRRNQGGN